MQAEKKSVLSNTSFFSIMNKNKSMTYHILEWKDLSVKAKTSQFTSPNGAAEYHVIFEITNVRLTAKQQFANIETAIKLLVCSDNFKKTGLVWKRYFVSDAINQAELLPKANDCAISVVQQPMLNHTKVAVWAYFVEDATILNEGNSTISMQHAGYKHLYTTQLHSRKTNEYIETEDIFDNYTKTLQKNACSLKDNCIRTWIYAHGVDVHYTGMVNARKRFFEDEQLTADTHYLASTGIEGKYIYPDSIILMDAYAINGIKEEQVTYLKGLSHLNPTIEYGVTFERATAVDYGDRRHIFVSGTASIDNKGQVVHPQEIDKQIERTMENIDVLLKEGDSNMEDVAHLIIYLRDTADYDLVSEYMDTHYAQIPKVIVWAPVCRPGWLIEIECMAIKATENPAFGKF